MEAACQRAMAFGDPAYRTVKTILERGVERQEEASALPLLSAGAFLRGPQELLAPMEIGADTQRAGVLL